MSEMRHDVTVFGKGYRATVFAEGGVSVEYFEPACNAWLVSDDSDDDHPTRASVLALAMDVRALMFAAEVTP